MRAMDPPNREARSGGHNSPHTERMDQTVPQPAVSIVPPAVPMAESWTDRVAHQRLRDQDLRRKGHSHIEDQKVIFINRNPYDENKLPAAPQAQSQTTRMDLNDPPVNNIRKAHRGYSLPRALGTKTEPPGIAEAIIQHQSEMEDRLSKLIFECLGTKLSLPEGFKLNQKMESSTIDKYAGTAKFADLENWLSATVYKMAVRQLGGQELDRIRVMLLMEHLDGEAKKWFIRHVTGVNQAKLDWTFEEVILALYNRFVHASTMQDAREGFRKAKYLPSTGVQGFYDTLMDHAQSMAVYPDDYSILEAFLEGIPESMRTQLIRELGLSPEINSINDFVSQAISYEARIKTDEYYRSRHRQHVVAAPPRMANDPPKNRPIKRRVISKGRLMVLRSHLAEEPDRPRDSRPLERSPFRPPLPITKPKPLATTPVKPGACFNCGSMDHFARDCKLPHRSGMVQLKAAHMAIPEDNEERLPEPPDKNTPQEGPEPLDKEEDAYTEVEVFDSDWYKSDA